MSLWNEARILLAIIFWLPASSFAAVGHVKVLVQQSVPGASNTSTFNTSATTAGDAICVQIAAAASTLPTSATLTASGWTFTQIAPVSGLTVWTATAVAATFCAIAPNTSSVTFTATFIAGSGYAAISILGDEFSGNDTTGGTTTFESANSATATSGSPTVNVTPVSNNDGLWGACQDTTSAVLAGFTKGADDTQGDWTEWKILSGQAGTPQTVSFTGGPGYIIQAVAIKPASVLINVKMKGRVRFKGNVKLK